MDAELDDDALWQAFTTQTLPSSAWTHRAHLRVASLHLRRHGLEGAHVLMRVGIIRLNAAHGLVETVARGYHETLTRAWLVMIDDAMRGGPFDDTRRFADAHRERLGSDAPLRYYSRARVLSLEARARFVEPDLAPLPAPPEGPRGEP